MKLKKSMTGNKAIDAGHQAIIEMADKMSKTREDRNAGPAYDRVLKEIVAHFAEEEALMEAHAFPRIEEHKREHASLLRIVHNCRTQTGDDIALSLSLSHFLEVWMAQHMRIADRDLADFLDT